MQIKDDPSLKWLERMNGDPSNWNKSKYYRFHRDLVSGTKACIVVFIVTMDMIQMNAMT